jgi:hypothetical protein
MFKPLGPAAEMLVPLATALKMPASDSAVGTVTKPELVNRATSSLKPLVAVAVQPAPAIKLATSTKAVVVARAFIGILAIHLESLTHLSAQFAERWDFSFGIAENSVY